MISSVTTNVTRLRQDPVDFWNSSTTRNRLGDTTTRYDSLFDNRTTTSTESILQFIEESALSRRDSLSILIPITVLYVVMLFTGLIGNIATCVVIARNKSMHTATNYYLCSLAMSDLLLLVSGLPMEMWSIWSFPYIFGETFCILQSFAAETSANATVLTITAFTVERYVAICHPFISHTLSNLSRAVKFIVAIWLLALCLAVPQAIQFGIMYNYKADNTTVILDSARCSMKWILVEHAFEISTFLFFVLPVTIIIVLYVLIAIKLRSSSMLTKNINGSHVRGILNHVDSAKRRKENAQKNVVRMLVAVVVTFIICWAPFHAQRLLAVYAKSRMEKRPEEVPALQSIYEILTYVSGVFYYLSTTVNPILYQIMSKKFRQAFKSMLPKWYIKKCVSRQDSRQQTYSSLTRCQKPTRHRLDGTQHATFVVDNDEQRRLTHIALTDVMSYEVKGRNAKESNGFFVQQRPDSTPTREQQPGNVPPARYERDTSNSSLLKDLEETEFTGTELACYMTTRQYWKGA